MKKLIIISLLVFVSLEGFSQFGLRQVGNRLTNDTIFVADILARSKTDTVFYQSLRAPDGCMVDVDFSSFGATQDTIMVGQSVDGIHWQVVEDGVLDTSTDDGNYFNGTTAGKGQMFHFNTNPSLYLSIYYKNNTASNDTIVIRYNK